MTPHACGMHHTASDTQNIAMSDGTVCATNTVGDIVGAIIDRHGNEVSRAILKDVALSPSGFNLFSCTKMQQRGWSLGGDDKSIWLQKDGNTLTFDIAITTRKGVVFAMCFCCLQNTLQHVYQEVAASQLPLPPPMKMNLMTAHERLGHVGMATTKKMASSLNWILTRNPQPCEWCAVAKAKQKSVPQVSHTTPLVRASAGYT